MTGGRYRPDLTAFRIKVGLAHLASEAKIPSDQMWISDASATCTLANTMKGIVHSAAAYDLQRSWHVPWEAHIQMVRQAVK